MQAFLNISVWLFFTMPVWTFCVLVGYGVRYILTGKEF